MLTVGSDCAIGKMTRLARARRRGAAARRSRSEFVPTGQTGIAIAGWGISVDAVVADFLAGASERLVLEGVARGGELLWVEGQGSLLHPAYSGVTLGLLHGSRAARLVLCHLAGQAFVDDDERFPMPSLAELVELHERMSLLARPARVVAIALNTRDARRGRRARRDRRRRGARRACRPTIRSASAASGSRRAVLAAVRGSALELAATASRPRAAASRRIDERAAMRKLGNGAGVPLVARSRSRGTAAADLRVGVNDDAGKYESARRRWFYPTMAATACSVNAITLRWDETPPTAIAPTQPLDRAGDRAAQASGVDGRARPLSAPLAGVHGRRALRAVDRTRRRAATRRGSSSSPPGPRRVAQTFPSVREFVVMNECNQPLFLNPQWDTSGQNQSAAICGRALAAAYDALKGVSSGNFVWGVGLSPRGNDSPNAASNSSTTPVTFLGALGAWFTAFAKKTGRTAPLMDGLDFHPYPVPQSLPFATGYADERSASVSNLPRIYQAFYDGFNGTPQRTIGQQRAAGCPSA